MTAANPAANLELEIADLLVEVLNLDLAGSAIDPQAPLFGEQGLGLDSIDVLEMAVAISSRYGFQLRSDDAENERIFASLRSLSTHVARQRTQ
jgi:acyl carrier protein